MSWNASAGRRNWLIIAAGTVYFGLILIPFIAIIIFAESSAGLSEAVPDAGRATRLLFQSLELAAGAATLATLLGWPFACIGVGRSGMLAAAGRWFVAILLFLPPYLNTIGLISFFDMARRLGFGTMVFPQGMGWAIAVLGAAFAPLAALIGEQALASIDRSAAESSLMAMPPAESWRRIWLPFWKSPFLGSWLVIFWLTVVEYGVPIHFQVPVLSTDLVSAFVGGATAEAIMRAGFPLALTGWLAGGIGLYSLSGFLTGPGRKRENPPVMLFEPSRWPGIWRLAHGVGVAGFFLATLIPLFGLVGGATGSWTGAGLWLAWPAFLFSIGLAIVVSGMAVAIANPLGDFIAGKGDLRWIMLFLFPICFPPVLVGFAHAVAWSRPELAFLHGKGAGLLTAHLSRILPLCLLLTLLARRGAGRSSASDAALLSGNRWLRFRLGFPVILPVFLLGFLLSLRELDVSLLTIPPGGETLPLRLFNLMHYGAGTDVCRLGLLLSALVGTVMGLLSLAISRSGDFDE